ncbi:RNA polymerase sigma factor [Catenulispora rubra]|uniref:RNA polymerase sigma factor n=1 Tax=Catenulispora rubra TaxID=280293 RepID=UPI0018927BA1|nr:RNA polymerase sigma factor [Catenulispora rubra]
MSAAPIASTNTMDAQDFDTLYEMVYPKLRRYLVAVGAAPDYVDDIVQESFEEYLKVWQRVGSPAAWLHLVARRRLADRWRRQYPEPKTLEALQELMPPTNAADIDVDTRISVLAAMGQLSRRQKEVMALTADGYTTLEIAEILGISADNVRSNLRYARIVLRDILAPRRQAVENSQQRNGELSPRRELAARGFEEARNQVSNMNTRTRAVVTAYWSPTEREAA